MKSCQTGRKLKSTNPTTRPGGYEGRKEEIMFKIERKTGYISIRTKNNWWLIGNVYGNGFTISPFSRYDKEQNRMPSKAEIARLDAIMKEMKEWANGAL